MNIQSVFHSKEGESFIVIADQDPRGLIDLLRPLAVKETLVAGVTSNKKVWARFQLKEEAPLSTIKIRVIYMRKLYDIEFKAVTVGDFAIIDGYDIIRTPEGTLYHAFGIAPNGNMVGFPAFYKRLGEVPNCTRCPFWVTNQDEERECALFRWQPAGLRHLNEPACSIEDRSRHGIRLLKIFDFIEEDAPIGILSQVVHHKLKLIRNAERFKSAEVHPLSKIERTERDAAKLNLSQYVLEMDSKLADVGCEYPLWDVPEEALKKVIYETTSLREAAKVINILSEEHGMRTINEDALTQAIEEARLEDEEESIEYMLEKNLL